MDDSTKYYAAGAGAVGVLSHLLYFIRGEHHRYAHKWITRALTGIAIVAVGALRVSAYQPLPTLVLTFVLTTMYFVGLYGSMVLYRMFFHPLRKFKGPFLARASNLYHMRMIRKSDNYLVMKKLHEEYGPIIRTGEEILLSFVLETKLTIRFYVQALLICLSTTRLPFP
jgi:hypothetical protein